jgi:hypothetical protein
MKKLRESRCRKSDAASVVARAEISRAFAVYNPDRQGIQGNGVKKISLTPSS